MEGVEDIPGAVLAEGLPWNWESFPEFLDALEARRYDIDFAAQLPHAALRVYVMGERGADREPATSDDIAAMAALAREAVEAGALGFSTSRTLNHRSSDGQADADADRRRGRAARHRAARSAPRGKGVLQFVSDFTDAEARDGHAAAAGRRSRAGRCRCRSCRPSSPARLAAHCSLARAKPRPRACRCARRSPAGRSGSCSASSTTLNPFSTPRELARDRGAAAGREGRARCAIPRSARSSWRRSRRAKRPSWRRCSRTSRRCTCCGDPPDYEQTRSERSLGAQARARGIAPAELALDRMLANDGRGMLYLPFLNYAEGVARRLRSR